jgi:hypothetical protein
MDLKDPQSITWNQVATQKDRAGTAIEQSGNWVPRKPKNLSLDEHPPLRVGKGIPSKPKT